MLLGWIIICVTSVGVLMLLRRAWADERRVMWLWFLCNLLIFTPAQWENLIWGIGIANLTPMALIVWMLVSIGGGWKRTVGAILLAAAASYASGNGMLAWPIGFAVILSRKRKRSEQMAWIAAAALFIGWYFVGYTKPTHGGVQTYADDIIPAVQYFVVFLGSPFAFSTNYSPYGAAALAGIICAIGWTILAFQRRPEHIEWLVIGFFAIASAGMAACARTGMGIGQALASTRYVSFALWLPVALVVMSSGLKNIRSVVATSLVLLVVLSYPLAINACRVEHFYRRQEKGALLLINILSDNPLIRDRIYPLPEVAIQNANAVNQLGWLRPPLIKSNRAAEIIEVEPGRIETIKGRLERGGRRGGGELSAYGYAASLDNNGPADAVFLTYDDPTGQPIIFAFAELGVIRADIAQQYGETYTPCGWVANFAESKLMQKPATIRAWALNVDTGKAVLLPGETKLP
jgi:hypothetical protein